MPLYADPQLQGDGNWDAVPATTRSLITDLANQFQAMVGAQPLPTTLLAAMAEAGVENLFQVGQFVQSWGPQYDSGLSGLGTMHPGSFYGIADDQYKHTLTQLRDSYFNQTGQDPSMGDLQYALENQLSSTEWINELKDKGGMGDAFGWVKLGMDYQTFQSEKSYLRTAFGHELTDEEALTHFKEQHENQSAKGGGAEAVLKPPAQQKTDATDPMAMAEIR